MTPENLRKMYVVLFLGISCAHENTRKPVSITPDERLAAKLDEYCELAREHVDARGYAVSKGDALLFTAIHNAACGYPSLDDFCNQEGRCYRDPARTEVPVFDSTFSKDMALGLLIHSATRRNGILNRWINYGDANNWKVGDAVENEVGTVLMSPDIVTLAHDVRAFQSGDDARSARDEGNYAVLGYQSHLAVWRQLIEHRINGGLTDESIEILRRHSTREPNNALYQAAIGLYDGRRTCVDLLLSWPNRLPTSDDWCSDYKYQRDELTTEKYIADGEGCIWYVRPDGYTHQKCDFNPGDEVYQYGYNDDWLPCAHGKSFDGTDFAGAAMVCLGRF